MKILLQKICAQICVFRYFFVPLQQISNLCPMNSERERIEYLMKTLDLSARQFAAQIHVQPGTISNMMAGRNNPSYEVIKRILQRYETLNPEWLVFGEGEMWRTAPGEDPQLFDTLPPDVKANRRAATQKTEEPQVVVAPPKKISRIVVYYSDNTYEEFRN